MVLRRGSPIVIYILLIIFSVMKRRICHGFSHLTDAHKCAVRKSTFITAFTIILHLSRQEASRNAIYILVMFIK